MSVSATGLFISFEGGEGSGKTTQIALLAQSLQGQGREIITTREPGGTPEAEKIRNLLVQRDGGEWTPLAETLLFFTARHMHVETLIKPALAQGKIVICDRFTDSTRAYQCYGHGLARQVVEEIKSITIGDFEPDLTFILDLPAEKGLGRARKRLDQDESCEDRFEQLDISYHEKLRQGYLNIAREDPARCRVIDALGTADDIAGFIFKTVQTAAGKERAYG